MKRSRFTEEQIIGMPPPPPQPENGRFMIHVIACSEQLERTPPVKAALWGSEQLGMLRS